MIPIIKKGFLTSALLTMLVAGFSYGPSRAAAIDEVNLKEIFGHSTEDEMLDKLGIQKAIIIPLAAKALWKAGQQDIKNYFIKGAFGDIEEQINSIPTDNKYINTELIKDMVSGQMSETENKVSLDYNFDQYLADPSKPWSLTSNIKPGVDPWQAFAAQAKGANNDLFAYLEMIGRSQYLLSRDRGYRAAAAKEYSEIQTSQLRWAETAMTKDSLYNAVLQIFFSLITS